MNEHNCQELLGALSDYVGGEASAAICEEIEQHMAGCPNCRVVIDTLRKTIDLYRELPKPDMPDGVRERLFLSLDLDNLLKR